MPSLFLTCHGNSWYATSKAKSRSLLLDTAVWVCELKTHNREPDRFLFQSCLFLNCSFTENEKRGQFQDVLILRKVIQNGQILQYFQKMTNAKADQNLHSIKQKTCLPTSPPPPPKKILGIFLFHHKLDEKSSCSGTAGKCVEVNHNTPGLASQEAKCFDAMGTQLGRMFPGEQKDHPSSS